MVYHYHHDTEVVVVVYYSDIGCHRHIDMLDPGSVGKDIDASLGIVRVLDVLRGTTRDEIPPSYYAYQQQQQQQYYQINRLVDKANLK